MNRSKASNTGLTFRRLRAVRDIPARFSSDDGLPTAPSVAEGTELFAHDDPDRPLDASDIAVTAVPGELPWFPVSRGAVKAVSKSEAEDA